MKRCVWFESLYKAGHEADAIEPVSWHLEQYLRSLLIITSEALTSDGLHQRELATSSLAINGTTH